MVPTILGQDSGIRQLEFPQSQISLGSGPHRSIGCDCLTARILNLERTRSVFRRPSVEQRKGGQFLKKAICEQLVQMRLLEKDNKCSPIRGLTTTLP